MSQAPRILIVEDNRAVARDIEQRLGRLGFAIAGVTGVGEDALMLAERERPELVLMDIRLDGAMDGITCAEQLRARHGLPVVFLTMFADDATLRAASVTEAFGYIVKPAQDRELRIVIEMALYKHAAEQERRRLEEQLRRSEKMEAIGQLAGGIAHDFNNVLMAILSNCRTLLAQLPTDQSAHRQVEQIEVAAERAAHMTRQLLAFGRDADDQPVALDLGAHVRRTAGLLTHLIGDRIAVDIAIASDVRAVLLRSSELEQVIMNLVLNARDAMPDGGTVSITAHNAVDSDQVQLVVADTGHGMDEATRARAFEPFFTTKDVGEGTGLGLATVYAVVSRARGRIDVASAPGKGTRFTIWLPTTDAVPVEPVEHDDELGAPIDASIVLVEDDEQVRSVIRDILERAGLRVIEARDGHEALAACKSHPGIDLVLSDVVMPRLGGAELARTLAVEAPGTKVIYMSGYPNRGVPGGRSQDLGPVLQKPFTPGELLDWIRGALRSKAASAA
jgi:two-component system cell cycle sensor histidine kinase/response regulator CckA